jgi:hypothetical protein
MLLKSIARLLLSRKGLSHKEAQKAQKKGRQRKEGT